MKPPPFATWLDKDGQPLPAHIMQVLTRLMPRLCRQFPRLNDDVIVTNILETAGSRLATKERREGPIEKLHGYAWVTVRSVAASELRRSAARVLHNTLDLSGGEALLESTRAVSGGPEDIERRILFREVLGKLSHEERLVFMWKTAGFSTHEIAAHQGRSETSVDTLFSRAKQKVRRLLSDQAIPSRQKEVNSKQRASG